jgi:sRNA-binding carbon storage regulator CsrA
MTGERQVQARAIAAGFNVTPGDLDAFRLCSALGRHHIGRCRVLVLTCRMGGTLRIDDDIHVTLLGRLRDRVTVGVLAPRGAAVMLDRTCLQPQVLPSGTCSYLFSLMGVRRFRVGTIEVGVWVAGETEPLAAGCEDFIHIGLTAPEPLRIGYEQERCKHSSARLALPSCSSPAALCH